MRILTSKKPPSSKEIIEVLKSEFSHKYRYSLFGLGEEKNIIVKKSTFVGAQISKREKEFTIDGIPPSISASFVALILSWFANLYILFAPSPYRKLEKEIAAFLTRKYN